MKKMLITGRSGMIGSHAANYFNQFYNVFSLGRTQLKIKQHFSHCDITDNESVKRVMDQVKPDIILHLAANPIVKHNFDNPNDLLMTNVIGTNTLLNNAPCNCKFVFASSIVVYDENVQVHNIKSPLKAKSIYAASKIAGENLCYSYREYRNIQPIIVRLGATIGAGLTHGLIYDIIRKLKTNNELELLGNEPGSCKPFTYINDVLGGIHTAINTNISLCNLCNQNPITVKTVAETVMDTLNIHKKIVWNDANWAGDNNTLFGESFLNGCSIEAVKRCVNDIVGNN